MSWLASLKSKITSRSRTYQSRVTNKAREKTVGRAQAKVFRAEARMDQAVWSAQDRAMGESASTAHPQQRLGSAPEPPRPLPQVDPAAEAAASTRMVNLEELGLAPARRRVRGWLVAQNGPERGRDFRLFEGKNTVGAAATNDIVVTDPHISAQHAVLMRDEEGSFTLVDLDSTCGSYLNGRRVHRQSLIEQDTVKLGRTVFKFYAL